MVAPGTPEDIVVSYGLATRGWDLVEPWGLGLTSPMGGVASLQVSPMDLGGASDSYADGPLLVVDSASDDSPEATVDAFHRAIQDWEVAAICAQLSSQAQVHFTGRLVAGDCPGVIREVMSFDWQGRIQEQHATPEVLELWTSGDAVPEDETIINVDSDNIYAVIRPSAGSSTYLYYDFVLEDGGIKIDIYFPIR